MDLTLCSFNCCSLKKNIDIVRELTSKKFDIIMLQETMLTVEKLGDLNYVDENYESVGVGATFSYKSLESMAGRPQGGMACLWRSDSEFNIDKIILENNMILILVSIGNRKIMLVNVYIKSDLGDIDTLNNYLSALNDLEIILTDYEYDCIYFGGDFNADPFTGRAWHSLKDFILRCDLECFDFSGLDADTFTFTSYGSSICKWLDHFVGRNCVGINIENFIVHYDQIGSDHLPISATLSIDRSLVLLQSSINPKRDFIHGKINWNKLKSNEIKSIEESIYGSIGGLMECEAARCRQSGCSDRGHVDQICKIYDKLICSVERGTVRFHRRVRGQNKFKVIPGWNRNVKNLHRIARYHYLKWKESGRHRDTIEFTQMTESRKCFKKSLKECKKNEFEEICISIENKYKNKDMNSFWKEVKRKKSNSKKSTIIDGKTHDVDILNIFTDRFLKCNGQGTEPLNEQQLIDDINHKWLSCPKMNLRISPHRIKELSSRLNNGAGHDGIHPLLLKNGSHGFLSFIANFINICYTHCILPPYLLKGDLNPTIKDLKGNITESLNYRPVMQSSCLLKLVELHILSVLEEKIFFNTRQFGFSKGSSTSDACLILKETVSSYIKLKGKAYSVFVDLSKAFDMVDHCILGRKLLDRSIPPDLVLLLMRYLRNQSARVCWNNSRGSYCPINTGVRQGGILSPFLFKLYIDDLIGKISKLNFGCRLGFIRFNIIGYADDIVLLADSVESLELLYSVFKDEIHKLKLKMNTNKSKCMIFEKGQPATSINDIALANDNFEIVTSYKYLGHIVNSQLMDNDDARFRLNNFYSKFNTVYRNFSNVSIETFLFLFNAYCVPDYGLGLWNCTELFNKPIFKAFETAFNNSLKKIIGAPRYSSSHITANLCSQLILRHYTAVLQWRYMQRIFCSNNSILKSCMINIKEGYLVRSLTWLLMEVYGVEIECGGLDVIRARVTWVQNHEERRRYCPFYGF